MKKYLLLLLLLITLQYAHAQPAHLSFDHLGINQGLPDNNINDMIQDNQGYMWFATYNGIVRYEVLTTHKNKKPRGHAGLCS